MKYALLLLTALLVTVGLSAQGPQDGEPYEFTGVVQVDSTIRADVLFNRARRWFTDNFNSGKTVIDYENKELGDITGVGNFTHTMVFIKGLNQADGIIKFSVNIQVKNGRYRYRIYNFTHEVYDRRYNNFGLITTARISPPQSWNPIGGEMADKQWLRMQAAVQEKGKFIAESLISYMAKAAQTTDDW